MPGVIQSDMGYPLLVLPAFGGIRVMVNLNQTGEAAGVTASLAASRAKPVSQVDAESVRKDLSRLGAAIV